tara:strand:- start:80 stop:247 length:168 start_codon:yes stop_codon:yes gene_type:complete
VAKSEQKEQQECGEEKENQERNHTNLSVVKIKDSIQENTKNAIYTFCEIYGINFT